MDEKKYTMNDMHDAIRNSQNDVELFVWYIEEEIKNLKSTGLNELQKKYISRIEESLAMIKKISQSKGGDST